MFKLWTIHRQYSKHWHRDGVMVMKSGSYFILMSIGVKRPRTPGNPKAACCNFPASFYNSFNVILFFLSILQRRVQIFLNFRSGSHIVPSCPSNYQTSTSLVMSHITPPFSKFCFRDGVKTVMSRHCRGRKYCMDAM